jgi:hypothetical protein
MMRPASPFSHLLTGYNYLYLYRENDPLSSTILVHGIIENMQKRIRILMGIDIKNGIRLIPGFLKAAVYVRYCLENASSPRHINVLFSNTILPFVNTTCIVNHHVTLRNTVNELGDFCWSRNEEYPVDNYLAHGWINTRRVTTVHWREIGLPLAEDNDWRTLTYAEHLDRFVAYNRIELTTTIDFGPSNHLVNQDLFDMTSWEYEGKLHSALIHRIITSLIYTIAHDTRDFDHLLMVCGTEYHDDEMPGVDMDQYENTHPRVDTHTGVPIDDDETDNEDVAVPIEPVAAPVQPVAVPIDDGETDTEDAPVGPLAPVEPLAEDAPVEPLTKKQCVV